MKILKFKLIKLLFKIKQKHFFMILVISDLTKIISKIKLWNFVPGLKRIKFYSAVLL
jgi:hypothetical protein